VLGNRGLLLVAVPASQIPIPGPLELPCGLGAHSVAANSPRERALLTESEFPGEDKKVAWKGPRRPGSVAALPSGQSR